MFASEWQHSGVANAQYHDLAGAEARDVGDAERGLVLPPGSERLFENTASCVEARWRLTVSKGTQAGCGRPCDSDGDVQMNNYVNSMLMIFLAPRSCEFPWSTSPLFHDFPFDEL